LASRRHNEHWSDFNEVCAPRHDPRSNERDVMARVNEASVGGLRKIKTGRLGKRDQLI
jgi:hypothetical protein